MSRSTPSDCLCVCAVHVVLASNEVVSMRSTLDHRTSALLTFRNWLTASNLRLVVLLMTVRLAEIYI